MPCLLPFFIFSYEDRSQPECREGRIFKPSVSFGGRTTAWSLPWGSFTSLRPQGTAGYGNLIFEDMSGCKTEDEIGRKLKRIPDADIYAIGVFCTTHRNAKRMIARIREQRPGAYVIVGGPNPSALPEFTLADLGADVVVRGRRGGGRRCRLPGVVFRQYARKRRRFRQAAAGHRQSCLSGQRPVRTRELLPKADGKMRIVDDSLARMPAWLHPLQLDGDGCGSAAHPVPKPSEYRLGNRFSQGPMAVFSIQRRLFYRAPATGTTVLLSGFVRYSISYFRKG